MIVGGWTGVWVTATPVTHAQFQAAKPTLRVALELGRWVVLVDGVVWRFNPAASWPA